VAEKTETNLAFQLWKETSAENCADLVAEFTAAKYSGFFRYTRCPQNWGDLIAEN
jgi:hypothetical protein